MKCLIIDDSKMARRMIIKALTALFGDDKEIIEACCGKEGIELYKEHKPDICFLDLTMPGLSGFVVTKSISEYDEDAKIVIISADIQETSIRRAREKGASGFVKKPINTSKLSDALNRLGMLK